MIHTPGETHHTAGKLRLLWIVDHESPLPGTPLNTEKGWVPGLSVTGSIMRDVGSLQNVYLWGRFSWMKGNTNYWNCCEPPAVDGATVSDWDFRLGKGFSMGQNAMLTPYFGIGTNSWTRIITEPEFREVYSHDYAGGGLLLQYSPAPRLVLSANGLVGTAFASSMTFTPLPGGVGGIGQTYTLGNKVVYMAGGSADYAFNDHWHGNVGIDYTHFAYGQSPISPIDGSVEPNSTTSYLTLSVGLGYSFYGGGGGPALVTK